jgi:hypothetical protein
VLPAGVDLSGRIETEQQNDQEEDYRCYAHGLFDHRQKIAATRKASRTPSNGLGTANQKEKSQPEPWAIEFVFTLFSQAFEDRHFTEAGNLSLIQFLRDSARSDFRIRIDPEHDNPPIPVSS